MIKEIRGKRALLTGASRGIGVHLARALASEGAELVLTARDVASLEGTAAECLGLGAKVELVAADLGSAADRARLVEEAGAIDILVNNAGLEIPVAYVEQSERDVMRQLETNLVAPLDLTKKVLPGMLARHRGAIVNVSSMSGKSPTPYNSVYAATKYGLNGFTASLRIELEGTGVHAGVVCPSFVAESGMWASTGVRAPALMREVPPSKVAAGMLAVIRGEGQVLVTPGPVKPLLAIAELMPGATAKVLGALGVTKVLLARAEHTRRLLTEQSSRAG
ncbi:SDR family NAD(P)-dependent oxidoreductase [Myxococcota bacterium]|nr:SDR family NAD(P)-dependent oxidoreductase [Myxococcota bacterium]